MMRFAVCLLSCAFALAGCAENATTPDLAESNASEMHSDQVIVDLQHTMTADGVRKALLLGDTAYVQQRTQQLDLVNVKLDFFDENGRESGKLTSKTGEFQMRTGAMIARGTVVLNMSGTQGRRHLETEELHFDPNNDRIWSTTPFVMRENGRTVRGRSFTSDTQFRNFRIQGTETTGGGIRF